MVSKKSLSSIMDKLLDKKEIQKLTTDLYQGKTQQELLVEHEEAHREFVTYRMKVFDKTKNQAEGDWLAEFPTTRTWIDKYPRKLTTGGTQNIINKINEIIETLNKLGY